MNARWLDKRSMPAAAMLISIWNRLMTDIHKRSRKSHKNSWVMDYASQYISNELKEVGRYTALSSSSQVIMVQAPNGTSHIVDLEKQTYTCLDFQNKKLPCCHALRACQEYNLEPESYIDRWYTLETYCHTYELPMLPIRMEDFDLSSHCFAPLIRKKSGRPKRKR